MEKSPENSFDTFAPANGFGRVLNHPSDEVMEELDLELNPEKKKLDILHTQTLNPTESKLEKPSFSKEFRVSGDVIEYISNIKPETTNPDRARDISYLIKFLIPRLQNAGTFDEAKEVADRLLATGCVNAEQHEHILSLLDTDTSTDAGNENDFSVAEIEIKKDEPVDSGVDLDLPLKQDSVDEQVTPEVQATNPVEDTPEVVIEQDKPVADVVESEPQHHQSFEVPTGLVEYIDNLISQGRKELRVLRWDLDYIKSEEKLREYILKNKKYILNNEYQDIIGLIDGGKVNSSEAEVSAEVPRAVEIAMEQPGEEIVSDNAEQALQTSPVVETPSEEVVAIEKNTVVPEESSAVAKKVLEGEVLRPEGEAPIEKKKGLPDIDGEVVESSIEDIENALSEARSRYAEETVKWKESVRSKKNFFHKALHSLGVEGTLPETERPDELLSAEKEYIEAKRNKYKKLGLFEKAKPVKKENKYGLPIFEGDFNEEMMNETEKEKDVLIRKILEGLPDKKEKNIVSKALGKWSSIPMAKRLAISTLLATGAVAGLASGVTLAGAAVYGGSRLVRSAVGMGVAQGVGKGLDGIHKRINKKKDAEDLKFYGTNITEESFAHKETELLRDLEKSQNRVKKQNRLKAIAMMATAGVTAAGMGSYESGISNQDIPKGAGLVPEKVTGAESVSSMPDIKVDLSPKGFIQDIQNLKAKVIEHYGGAENVPETVKTGILDQSSVQLAKDFGLYDPENNASGLGLKGESLVVDSNGNIVLEHLGGEKELLYDGKTTEVRQFAGKMVVNDIPEPETSPDVPELPPEAPEVATEEPAVTEVPKDVEPSANDKTAETITAESWNTHFVDKGGLRVLNFESGGISKDIAFEQKTELGKVLVLDNKFQDGDGLNRLAREAYSVVVDHENAVSPISEIPPIPFEGGRITVIQGFGENPNEIRVLLNGRQFAEGYINAKETSFEIMNEKDIQGGWLMADTPYERAFKHIKPIIKTLKMK